MDENNKIKPNRKQGKKLNELLFHGNQVLRVLYILLIVLLVYILTLVVSEWHILPVIGKIVSIVSPLFIGWFIAWLLNPLVKRLTNKGCKKIIAVVITYVILIVVLGLIIGLMVPTIGEQINDITKSIPNISKKMTKGINNFFDDFASYGVDATKAKEKVLKTISNKATELQEGLPNMVITFVSGIVSGLGKILISLIIGFYVLLDFDKFTKTFINLFPKGTRNELKFLMDKLNDSLSSFVSGTLWLSLLLFIVSLIGFSIIGLKAPLLIAFICAITNLIPYVGPYIGAAVAGVIGFTQSTKIGILTLIFILIVQTIDGEILNPLVMSKKLDLSPITIIISLLIFEYLFGIFGMVIATPAVAILKIIYTHLDSKYNFFNHEDDEIEE